MPPSAPTWAQPTDTHSVIDKVRSTDSPLALGAEYKLASLESAWLSSD